MYVLIPLLVQSRQSELVHSYFEDQRLDYQTSFILVVYISHRTYELFTPITFYNWDDGYKAGYMGVYPISEHTRDFWAGYKSGADQVGWDKEFCKDTLMRDDQSCMNISHYEGPLNLVATSGPVECHEESGNHVCEAGIGQVGNSNESKSNTTGYLQS